MKMNKEKEDIKDEYETFFVKPFFTPMYQFH